MPLLSRPFVLSSAKDVRRVQVEQAATFLNTYHTQTVQNGVPEQIIRRNIDVLVTFLSGLVLLLQLLTRALDLLEGVWDLLAAWGHAWWWCMGFACWPMLAMLRAWYYVVLKLPLGMCTWWIYKIRSVSTDITIKWINRHGRVSGPWPVERKKGFLLLDGCRDAHIKGDGVPCPAHALMHWLHANLVVVVPSYGGLDLDRPYVLPGLFKAEPKGKVHARISLTGPSGMERPRGHRPQSTNMQSAHEHAHTSGIERSMHTWCHIPNPCACVR